jgi:hypothetical protein
LAWLEHREETAVARFERKNSFLLTECKPDRCELEEHVSDRGESEK